MRKSTLRSATLAVLLALTVPASAAAVPRPAARPQAVPALRAGSFVPWVWSQLLAFLQKNGCTIDPSGQPCTREAVTPDEGCTIDPSGRCQPAAPALAASDNGCTIDPNGCKR